MQEWYYGWWSRPRRITKRQIEEMIKNMKKTGVINEKSNEYHKKEQKEADDILKKIQNNDK